MKWADLATLGLPAVFGGREPRSNQEPAFAEDSRSPRLVSQLAFLGVSLAAARATRSGLDFWLRRNDVQGDSLGLA